MMTGLLDCQLAHQEDNAEVMRERQDLYVKENAEVQQAKDLYRRMVQQDSSGAGSRGSPRPPHR